MHVCVCACVRARVCACARARVCACVRVCVEWECSAMAWCKCCTPHTVRTLEEGGGGASRSFFTARTLSDLKSANKKYTGDN